MTDFSSLVSSSLERRLEKLNPEQRNAVESIEGPVMVIAGPGTGKTETLGARIANILEKTDTSPHNILCLTYTNAGVVAMRKRLLEFIGPDAQKVEIHTFHSFCNTVIQENSDIFSDTREEENISALEQYEILDTLLNALPLENPFFAHHNLSLYSKDLLSFFSTLKSEKWTPQLIREQSQEYLDSLCNNPEFQYKQKYTDKKTGEVFQKGDIKKAQREKEEKKISKLLSAVSLFEEYSLAMKKRGKYDFQDMILWVLEKFSTHETLLAEYQERFQYILVDEFQDTNGSQKELIDYLISYWESPNIFVVGDDDQSIYRFQGANMRNILDFFSDHQNSLTPIVLTKNYRSTQSILDTAEAIITRNSERLVTEIPHLEKHLTAENSERKKELASPHAIGYYNEIHEQFGVFQKLKSLHTKGVNLSNVAVIYKNHRQAVDIIALCEQHKIPVRVKETQDVLTLPLFHFIREMLAYFEKEKNSPFSGETHLYKMMYFPFFNISQKDIALITLYLRENVSEKRKRENTDMEENENENADKNILIANCHLKTLLFRDDLSSYISGLETPESLLSFGEMLLDLEKYAHTKPLTSFFEHLLYDTKILEWIFQQEEKPYLMRIISTLFSFVREEHQKNPDLDISELLHIFEKMTRYSVSLPIQKILYEKEGVNFITAHSSKGLEFDTVFVIGVTKSAWDKPRKSDPISVPPTLTKSNEGDYIEEIRRLFFVAMTRAKQRLEISFPERNVSGKELDPSTFISELPFNAETVQFSEEDILTFQRSVFSPVAPEKISLLDEKYLQDILENYSLSPTHLNKYLACPRAFYFENFLRIPKAMVSPMAFGNAIHRVLEYALNMKQKTGSIPDIQKSIGVFQKEIEMYSYLFEEGEIQKKILYGTEIITQFLSNIPDTWEKKSSAEYSIRTGVDGVPINGKLDAVHFLERNEVRVVDYKTGKISNAKAKLLPPCAKNDFEGGEYWRQLVFYKILLENDMKNPWIMKEGAMSFVEGDSNDAHQKGSIEKIFTPSSEEVEKVKRQITDTYQKISNFEFSYGCEDCEWCGFWRNIV